MGYSVVKVMTICAFEVGSTESHCDVRLGEFMLCQLSC